MRGLPNQAGTSLLESTLILSMLIPVFSLGFGISVVAGLKSIGHQALYESLICIAQGETPHHCERQLKMQLRRIIVWGRCENLRLHRGPYTIRGDLTWSFGSQLRLKLRHQIPRRLEKAI
ncbi:MAG: hypothetical protein H6624_19530 [Bdellovibrionaceae bacterium]|nr:hypothetical protein [Bdellovibrionales bacterium]MCB9086542.1 hypothetical protein [Pseudobdellovibrionaceae bacterium]